MVWCGDGFNDLLGLGNGKSACGGGEKGGVGVEEGGQFGGKM